MHKEEVLREEDLTIEADLAQDQEEVDHNFDVEDIKEADTMDLLITEAPTEDEVAEIEVEEVHTMDREE